MKNAILLIDLVLMRPIIEQMDKYQNLLQFYLHGITKSKLLFNNILLCRLSTQSLVIPVQYANFYEVVGGHGSMGLQSDVTNAKN